jgi:N2,N2-dimethylguanosine tRNA methyltransferase
LTALLFLNFCRLQRLRSQSTNFVYISTRFTKRMSSGVTSGITITIPDGFTLHTENTSRILLPSSNEAFLNPVQEFNRDLSVACIRVWSEELNSFKETRWKNAQERSRNRKVDDGPDAKRSKSELRLLLVLLDVELLQRNLVCLQLLPSRKKVLRRCRLQMTGKIHYHRNKKR